MSPLQPPLTKFPHILLQFRRVQYPDVIGQADVEAADALHFVDIGVEIPDVHVALVGLDVRLGRGVFFHEQVLGHQVQLEGNMHGLVSRHVEHVHLYLLMRGGIFPRLVLQYLHIADAVDAEDAGGELVPVEGDDKAVVGPHVVCLHLPVSHLAAV